MKKIVAVFFVVLYTCFITGSLSCFANEYAFKNSIEANSLKKDDSPDRASIPLHISHFGKIAKHFNGKAKFPRSYTSSFLVKRIAPAPQNFFKTSFVSDVDFCNTSLFLKNRVFRI
jgi:hypothetical protein